MIHTKALKAADQHRQTELQLLNSLEEVWKNRTYYKYGCRSLFDYSVSKLGLSEEVASIFNKLAKKFTDVPELKTAIASGKVSVSKINRICSVTNKSNVDNWLKIAEGSKRNLEKQIALAHPEKALPERSRLKAVGETLRVEVKFSLTEEKFESFKRAQDLLSQKLQRPATIEDLVNEATQLFLEKHDPLKKSCPPTRTQTLSSVFKRTVHQQHHSQCTHINNQGERCTEQRFLHIHHIVPQSEGGTHTLENLTLLCAGHHRAHHVH